MITFLINRDFQDGYATAQNCTIIGSPEIMQALNPFKANILKTLHDAIQTANTLKTMNSGEIEPEQLVEEKKHKALMNQDTAHAALSAFMKPILEPHGIGILNSWDGAKWAFPMKQLGLKLCAKELTLVAGLMTCEFQLQINLSTRRTSWCHSSIIAHSARHATSTFTNGIPAMAKDPDDVDQYPLIENNKGETLLRICDIQPWLPKKSGTLIHPQCRIRRGNSKHDDPSPTPVRTSRTILRPIGALIHALTLTPALIPTLIPALAPDIVLVLNLLFNLSLNLKVIQGNSHDHDQEPLSSHTLYSKSRNPVGAGNSRSATKPLPASVPNRTRVTSSSGAGSGTGNSGALDSKLSVSTTMACSSLIEKSTSSHPRNIQDSTYGLPLISEGSEPDFRDPDVGDNHLPPKPLHHEDLHYGQ
ncbi:hypothetical protein BS47DRAFT_1402419 [Hydnum rufescens UP504]|uniref:Uncharacterized protein n=1 Tax=Hydnum rufescens UP504 TaxID=1448309 RepID=A0A9P6DGH4_9AGAM|nr:hypothetical protein BS47DRAFT_1402419 [Hydnum rufescens UP504]